MGTPDFTRVGPGLLGFFVIFALALATVLLIRSMVYHLRKVRYSPGPDGGAEESGSGSQEASPDRPDDPPTG